MLDALALDGGKAEIAQARASVGVDEDVSGFDVAVEDLGSVGGPQGGRDGRDDADCLGGAEFAAL